VVICYNKKRGGRLRILLKNLASFVVTKSTQKLKQKKLIQKDVFSPYSENDFIWHDFFYWKNFQQIELCFE
jgi:hypothetical protein